MQPNDNFKTNVNIKFFLHLLSQSASQLSRVGILSVHALCPLGYLVVCVVGACCRLGFVFGGVVLEFGKCWVVGMSIARGMYGTK